MEKKVKNDNHITIQGWMVNDLKLTGNDLLVYAIIYGFSQDDQSCFHGSRQYLAEWCGASVRGIQKNLNNLLELGLIVKKEHEAGKIVWYKALRNISSEQSSPGCEQSSLGGEQSSHNNIDNNINILKDNINIINNINTTELPKRNIPVSTDTVSKEEPKKKLNLYDKCALAIDEYTKDEKLKGLLYEYLQVRLKMKDRALLGASQWKALLRTLDKLNGDKCQIVETSIARGWASFYEVKNNYYNRPKDNRAAFAEDYNMGRVKPENVEGGENSGVIF